MTVSASRSFSASARAGWSPLAIVKCPEAVLSQPERAATATSPLLKNPAKQAFGAIKTPISIKARAIGAYAADCLAPFSS